MTGIKDYSTTPASNTSLFPEGMAPSSVNDSARQVQADIRSWYNTAEWQDLGNTPTYVSASSFSVTGNQTAFYTVGRRVMISDSSTLYGTISSSSFSTVTTVGVTLDSGSISASISAVAVGIISKPTGGTGSSLGTVGDVTTTGTQTLTNKTLTAPKINLIADTNGNEEIIFTTTASAVNEITVANAATGSNPKISATGGDSNIGLDFQAKGTGVYNFLATTSGQTEVRLFEDTDNGTNYMAIKPASSLASNFTMTFPNALPASKFGMQIDASGNVSFDGGSGNIKTVQTASASPTLDFTIDPANYDYEYYLLGLVPATDNVILNILTSENAFSSTQSVNTIAQSGTLSTTGALLETGMNFGETISYDKCNGVIFLSQPVSANAGVGSSIVTARNNADTAYLSTQATLITATPTTYLNRVRFQMSSGNIASGAIMQVAKPRT